MSKNPCTMTGNLRCVTGTSSAASRAAYASPSSRRGSYSAVISVAGGHARQAGRLARAQAPVVQVVDAAHAVVREPADVVLPEEEALGVVARRGGLRVVSRRRVDEELVRDRIAVRVACHQAGDGGEVAARRVAGDGDPPGPADKARDVLVGPERCRGGIFGGGGELVLGCQSVTHGDHHAPRVARDSPAAVVAGLQAADGPLSAVEVNNHRLRGPGAVVIDLGADLAGGGGGLAISRTLAMAGRDPSVDIRSSFSRAWATVCRCTGG